MDRINDVYQIYIMNKRLTPSKTFWISRFPKRRRLQYDSNKSGNNAQRCKRSQSKEHRGHKFPRHDSEYNINKQKIPHVEYIDDCNPSNHIEQSSSNPNGMFIHVHILGMHRRDILMPKLPPITMNPMNEKALPCRKWSCLAFLDTSSREPLKFGIKLEDLTSIRDYKWFIFVEVFVLKDHESWNSFEAK